MQLRMALHLLPCTERCSVQGLLAEDELCCKACKLLIWPQRAERKTGASFSKMEAKPRDKDEVLLGLSEKF